MCCYGNKLANGSLWGLLSAHLRFLIPVSMIPLGPFSRVQLCSDVLECLKSTWPGTSAEDVHGTMFLLVLFILMKS